MHRHKRRKPRNPKIHSTTEEVHVVEETAAVEPTSEPTVKPWYVDKNGFENEVGTYSTMFGDDVYAVKGSA